MSTMRLNNCFAATRLFYLKLPETTIGVLSEKRRSFSKKPKSLFIVTYDGLALFGYGI